MGERLNDTRLILGDCTDVLQQLIDEGVKVDLVITSPPYNLAMTEKSGGDLKVVYNKYKDDMPYDEYINWQIKILNMCYELLTDRGMIYYNHKDRRWNSGKYFFDPKAVFYNTEINMAQTIIWNRKGSVQHATGFWSPTHETVLVGYKNADKHMKVSLEFENYGSVWEFPPHRDEVQIATFPVGLPERIIGAYQQYGKLTVLDPFMGSGTTGVASRRFDMNFIGIEIDDLHFNHAKDKIAKVEEEKEIGRALKRKQKPLW